MSQVIVAQQQDSTKTEDFFKEDERWFGRKFRKPESDSSKSNVKRFYESTMSSDWDWDLDLRITSDGLDEHFYIGSSFGVKNPIYSAYPVNEMVRYNRVDGLFLGYKEDKMDWGYSDFLDIEGIDIHGLIGYSFGRRGWQYSVGAERTFGYKKRWIIGGELYDATSTEDYWRTGLWENSISSVMSGYDFMDYHNMEGYGFYTILQPLRWLELSGTYNNNVFQSLALENTYSLFGRRSVVRDNPVIDRQFDRIEQESVTLGLSLNPRGLTRSSSRVLGMLSVQAELNDLDGVDNTFFYNRYMTESKIHFQVDRSALLMWRMMGGAITGVAPEFKQFGLGGIGSLRALGFKQLTGNEMLLSNAELQFGSYSYPNTDWFDFDDLFLSLFLDSGWTNTNNVLFASNSPFDGFSSFALSDLSHNIGVGIGTGAWRFEVATPLSGESGATAFWFRLNPSF
ncbi:MAG: hypothetical protein AAFW89_05820 [Bacteroidota bacterium]